jgi:hypothetical protein
VRPWFGLIQKEEERGGERRGGKKKDGRRKMCLLKFLEAITSSLAKIKNIQ